MPQQHTTRRYHHKYKPPIDFVGYRVGHDGTVWSCWTRGADPVPCDDWRPLNAAPDANGYPTVELCNGPRRRKVCVHILVAELFLPAPRSDQWQVRHLDGNPSNNDASNLAWGNQTENEADKIGHGRHVVGSAKGNAKLTEEIVVDIRAALSQGWTGRALGARYGVSPMVISKIRTGKSWSHVQ